MSLKRQEKIKHKRSLLFHGSDGIVFVVAISATNKEIKNNNLK